MKTPVSAKVAYGEFLAQAVVQIAGCATQHPAAAEIGRMLVPLVPTDAASAAWRLRARMALARVRELAELLGPAASVPALADISALAAAALARFDVVPSQTRGHGYALHDTLERDAEQRAGEYNTAATAGRLTDSQEPR